MSCPFKHVWASEPAAQDTKRDPGSDDLLSDSASKLASVSLENGSENVHASENGLPKAATAACPMGFGARADASSDGPSAQAGAPSAPAAGAPATCPLGFGSSSGPKLTNLHCTICKSFLYDCVKTNCGHTYCRVCISRFQDCPTCGADVVSVEEDRESQSVVESFLSAHAGDKSIWQIEGTAPSINSANENDDEGETGKAAFLLQVGLRALSGGNPPSAACRLSQCMTQLESQLKDLENSENVAREAAEKVELLNKMGAVAGCLGDCYRAMGDAEQAIQQYTHSASILERLVSSSSSSDEKTAHDDSTTAAAKSLSVTINKIGEIYHLQGDLEKAVEKYKQALVLRQTRLNKIIKGENRDGEPGSRGGDGGGIIKKSPPPKVGSIYLEAAIDVAFSQLKVSNVLKTLLAEKNEEEEEEEEEAWQVLERAARELLQEIETCMNDNEEGDNGVDVKRKVQLLKAHVEG
ncbi:hypothetical protein Ndes2437B_g06628 [Nannochloris sp. 'desiccata']